MPAAFSIVARWCDVNMRIREIPIRWCRRGRGRRWCRPGCMWWWQRWRGAPHATGYGASEVLKVGGVSLQYTVEACRIVWGAGLFKCPAAAPCDGMIGAGYAAICGCSNLHLCNVTSAGVAQKVRAWSGPTLCCSSRGFGKQHQRWPHREREHGGQPALLAARTLCAQRPPRLATAAPAGARMGCTRTAATRTDPPGRPSTDPDHAKWQMPRARRNRRKAAR